MERRSVFGRNVSVPGLDGPEINVLAENQSVFGRNAPIWATTSRGFVKS